MKKVWVFYAGEYAAGIPSSQYSLDFDPEVEFDDEEHRGAIREEVESLFEVILGGIPNSIIFDDECGDCGWVLVESQCPNELCLYRTEEEE